MAKLTSKERKSLPGKDFSGPDRSYPDENKSHAKMALTDVSKFGSPKLKTEVRSKVKKDWPSIKQAGNPFVTRKK